MKHSSQSLDELIENYVYSIADKFINLTNAENQDKFIHLIHRIDSSTTQENAVNSTARQFIHRSFKVRNELSAEPYTVRLESQWQAALTKRVGWRRTYKDARITQIERIISMHQTTIELTRSHIYRLDQLLVRAENNISDTPRKRIVATHYQSLKNHYGTYLAKIQALQQREIRKLLEYE